jgi:hypothetical protein
MCHGQEQCSRFPRPGESAPHRFLNPAVAIKTALRDTWAQFGLWVERYQRAFGGNPLSLNRLNLMVHNTISD